jgi:hypothetical protein
VGSSGRGARVAGVMRAACMVRDGVVGDEWAFPNISISVVAGPSTNGNQSRSNGRIKEQMYQYLPGPRARRFPSAHQETDAISRVYFQSRCERGWRMDGCPCCV